MKQFYAYVRVSTARQGERGVSLQEQRDAISRYSQRNGLQILEWFEERETAAKRGRPVFTGMLRSLRKGKADGVLIHKIDRSARNLKDWADLGELIDQGITVHFANESLDLNSRGGRLSADIQAVVAADYIRNLREETKKGFYGRLKQGLLPVPAPVGYKDMGEGKPKEPHPSYGPLVKLAFEMYGGGKYGIIQLTEEMFRLGLRNRAGNRVSKNGISNMLNNPFYIGLIRLKSTGETFPGIHRPLISKALFERVQNVLHGRVNARGKHHRFLFSRMNGCKQCEYSLIAEKQKGIVYYRCHNCRFCLREDNIDWAVREQLRFLQFSADEKEYLKELMPRLDSTWAAQRATVLQSTQLALSAVKDKLGRLTDAYLDHSIDKELFENRKASLLLEKRGLEERIAELSVEQPRIADRLSKFLELAGNAYLAYETATLDEKRDLLQTVTSNRLADGKNVELMLKSPFDLVADRSKSSNGGPSRATYRTWNYLIPKISTTLDEKLTALKFFPGNEIAG